MKESKQWDQQVFIICDILSVSQRPLRKGVYK